MKIENPCENCIVKVMCITPCDELNEFAREVLTSTNYDEWLKKYECRSRVLGLVKISNIMRRSK